MSWAVDLAQNHIYSENKTFGLKNAWVNHGRARCPCLTAHYYRSSISSSLSFSFLSISFFSRPKRDSIRLCLNTRQSALYILFLFNIVLYLYTLRPPTSCRRRYPSTTNSPAHPSPNSCTFLSSFLSLFQFFFSSVSII